MKGLVLGLVILFAVLAKQGEGQTVGIYGCIGGCYNKCVLQGNVPFAAKLPCYFACSAGCFTDPSSSLQYYCQLGCSFLQCSRFFADGARMETCLGDCNRNFCGRKD